MTKVTFSSSFKRIFKKKVKGRKDLESRFWKKMKIFIENPFDERLKSHKLSGKLKDLWSFSVEYDTRVIFYFAKEDHVVFTDIGKHDEVY